VANEGGSLRRRSTQEGRPGRLRLCCLAWWPIGCRCSVRSDSEKL
jgi:hypothetical protein